MKSNTRTVLAIALSIIVIVAAVAYATPMENGIWEIVSILREIDDVVGGRAGVYGLPDRMDNIEASLRRIESVLYEIRDK